MQRIYKKSAEIPNPRVSLFKQLHIVQPGIFIATHIFKPNEEYDSATVSTRHFCVREKGEDWEVIRVGLIEAHKNGEIIAIDFSGKDYEYISLPNEEGSEMYYEKTAYGVKLIYPSPDVLILPREVSSVHQHGKVTSLDDAI